MVQKIKETFCVLLGFAGLVICMCETADPTKQIFVTLAGLIVLVIAVLLGLLEREEGLGSL